jgi:hypothetical protein
MADTPLSSLSNTFGSGYSTSNDLLLLDVLDTSMAATGTDKRITVAQFLANYSVLVSTGSYASPSWLTAISGGIVSGNISGNAASITGSITTSQVSNLSSWSGSTSITTAGTIATGTWTATAVGVQYGGTGANLSGTGGAANYLKQISTGAAVTVGTIAASDVPAAGSPGQLEYNAAGVRTGTADWSIGSSGQLTGTAISDPGSPSAGDLWISSSSGNLKAMTAGLPAPHGGIVWNGTSASAIANTASLTSIFASVNTLYGSLTIPAGTLKAGKVLVPYLYGTMSNVGSSVTLNITILLGGVQIGSSNTAPLSSGGPIAWSLGYAALSQIQIQSVGSSGSALAVFEFLYQTGASVSGAAFGSNSSGLATSWQAPQAITINTTGALLFDVKMQWSSANSGNTVQLLGGWLEIKG